MWRDVSDGNQSGPGRGCCSMEGSIVPVHLLLAREPQKLTAQPDTRMGSGRCARTRTRGRILSRPNYSRPRTSDSRRRLMQGRAGGHDFIVLWAACQQRLEERGVRFCEPSGKFPHVPRGGEEPGRCDGRENRAMRLQIATSWLKPRTKFPRYPLCEISRRASSRPARASHAAAAASAVGCAHPTRGVDCAAHDPCRHRGFDRDHVGTWHRRSPSRTDHRPTKT